MQPAQKGVSLNGATSQYDRWLADGPESVRVDARSFAELLSFAGQFGRLIRFYDLQDRPDGDWSLFFLTDPTMILASVVSLNLDDVERKIRTWMKQVQEPRSEGERLELVRSCIAYLVDIAREADTWLTGSLMNPRSHPARRMVAEIAGMIDTLLKEPIGHLASLSGAISWSGNAEGLHRPNFSGFHPLWGLTERPSAGQLTSGHSDAAKLDDATSAMDKILAAFLYVFREIQKLALALLPETLLEPYHKPQIALYIAFVRLFENAQRTMNTLSERFRRFYYDDILREKKAGPVPDSVYLILALDSAAGVDETSVPKGTLFPAGMEADGSKIFYASDSAVTVSAATLEMLRGLRIVNGPLYRPVITSPDAFHSSPPYPDSPLIREARQLVMGTELNVPFMNDEAAGKGSPAGLAAWDTFGASTSGASDIAISAPVSLGFAISSAYLMLTGGERTVSIVFWLRHGDASRLQPDLAQLSEATGLDPVAVFEQVINQSLDVWLSTASGWFQLPSYVCSPIPVRGSVPQAFSLSFFLEATAPPLVEFNPATLAQPPKPTGPDDLNPDPSLPTLKAYLRTTPVVVSGPEGEVETWPLSLLGEVGIIEVEIRTDTSKLTDLVIETTSGEVDDATPYPVFGSTPVTGSFLQFRNSELFVKTPDSGSLRIDLEWFGLPPNEDGFAGYYQGYVIGLNGQPSPTILFDNRTFQGLLEVVNPGMWELVNREAPQVGSPSPPTTGVFLFRTANDCSDALPAPAAALCPVTGFDYLETESRVPPEFYDPASSAIRLTLAEPPYAFGDSLYAANVMNATIAELPKTIDSLPSEPVCQPLSDAADSLKACLASNTGDIQTGVQQAQDGLIQSAQLFLMESAARLPKISSPEDDPTSEIRAAFDVPESALPGFRAQTIRSRLNAALKSVNSGVDFGSPPGWPEADALWLDFGSPPGWPQAAALWLSHAIGMLDGAVWMQQALDHCAAESGTVGSACLHAQLGACEQKLRQSFTACVKSSQPDPPAVPFPNSPWLPQAKSLSVSYSAHCRSVDVTYFHLLPFAGYEVADLNPSGVALLDIPPSGSLQLGFSSLAVAQPISMLVQMCSGNTPYPPSVSWEYLVSEPGAGTRWVPFDAAHIPLDTTNGLQNTGLITLNVPDDAQGDQTKMPGGYRWLRAATEMPNEFPDSIGIYPHPLTATWVDDGAGSGEHLSQSLPAYTIKSAADTLNAIQSIAQPIESFGGRPAENETIFPVVLAERLRHKDRAILAWDYERLVLEQFPTVWKVQALLATSTKGADSPGHVLVVVVAGQQSIQVVDATEPLVSADKLEEIRLFLADRASPFAVIQVVNPFYVRITVITEVLFQDSPVQENGSNGGGIDRLNSDLIQYLSPWFYDAERAANGGTYAEQDAISQFIQTRPYVAAVVKIAFEYEPFPETQEWYFLTSANTHRVTEADHAEKGEQKCFQ